MPKGSRKGSRKNRKSSRRNRRASRSSRAGCGSMAGRCWSRKQYGGQAPLNDTSMQSAGRLSLEQGTEYAKIHNAQHGGAAVSLVNSAPVGYTGVLDDALRTAARVTPLDASISAIQGLRDQSGGSRRRKAKGSRKGRKASRKGRKGSRKGRANLMRLFKAMKVRLSRRRGQRGGAGYQVANQADYSSPGMLLSPAAEAKALMGMNPEWKLAADPAAFAPKLR